jgi:hypothetical protein
MDQLLQRTECKLLSATNGDNAYGSEVVEKLLHAPNMQNSKVQADMLLLPMDSRNLADQGSTVFLLYVCGIFAVSLLSFGGSYLEHFCFIFHSVAEYVIRKDMAWNKRCVGIEAMVQLSQLAAATRSIPKIARVDLAALFLNRKKLLSENLHFGRCFYMFFSEEFCTVLFRLSFSCLFLLRSEFF